VAATRQVIAQAKRPVALIGHSYGGVSITEAGNDPKGSAPGCGDRAGLDEEAELVSECDQRPDDWRHDSEKQANPLGLRVEARRNESLLGLRPRYPAYQLGTFHIYRRIDSTGSPACHYL
jgi:hypothetical protein